MADEKNPQAQMSLFGDEPAARPTPTAGPRARHAELNRILAHAAYADYALVDP